MFAVRSLCCAALAAVAIVTTVNSGMADRRLTAKTLLGRWCEQAVYDFQPDRLIVSFTGGGQKVLRIKEVEMGDGWINVLWDPRDGINTVFQEFGGDTMVQKGNPDKGLPRREFHRC